MGNGNFLETKTKLRNKFNKLSGSINQHATVAH